MSQLPLPLSFDKRFSLSNYISADGPFIQQQLTALFDETGERLIGLCGGKDSGKTHLLNACAQYARESAIVFHLYDASQLQHANADHFTDLPAGSVIGVDNLDMVAGIRAWEEQFYRLINRVKSGELGFIFTTCRHPRETGYRLPDLKSRLMWGLLIDLATANDEQMEQILIQRARLMGLQISDGAFRYLLTHFSRQLSDQVDLLHRLDHASLSQKRRVTVPLIKQTLLE